MSSTINLDKWVGVRMAVDDIISVYGEGDDDDCYSVGFHHVDSDRGVGYVVTNHSAKSQTGYWVAEFAGDFELNERGLYESCICNTDDDEMYQIIVDDSIRLILDSLYYAFLHHPVFKYVNVNIEVIPYEDDASIGRLIFTFE